MSTWGWNIYAHPEGDPFLSWKIMGERDKGEFVDYMEDAYREIADWYGVMYVGDEGDNSKFAVERIENKDELRKQVKNLIGAARTVEELHKDIWDGINLGPETDH